MPISFRYGSNIINEKIIDIMEKVYTKDKIENLIKKDYQSWGRTLDEIESKKKQIDFNFAEDFKLDFPYIDAKCSGYFSKTDECLGNYNETLKIKYTSKNIFIPGKMIIEIITEIVDKIIGEINKIFTRIRGNIDVVVLTGGFSQCKIFQNKIRENFRGMPRELLFLDSPQQTVMKGAAIFGLRPNQILYRFSPVSIGIDNYEYIKKNEIDNYCIKTINDSEGKLRCLKYELFIQRGESVKINSIFQKIIQPISNSINIFYSYDDELNDQNKFGLGEINIPESQIPLVNRTLTLSIKFSNLINVTVLDDDNNKGNWAIFYYPS